MSAGCLFLFSCVCALRWKTDGRWHSPFECEDRNWTWWTVTDTVTLSSDETHRLNTHHSRDTDSETHTGQRGIVSSSLPFCKLALLPGFKWSDLHSSSTNTLEHENTSWCQTHGLSPPILQGSVLYQMVDWIGLEYVILLLLCSLCLSVQSLLMSFHYRPLLADSSITTTVVQSDVSPTVLFSISILSSCQRQEVAWTGGES